MLCGKNGCNLNLDIMKKTFEHKFEIGDRVKHVTIGSPKGIVLDFSYGAYNNKVRYQVSFGYDHDRWYDEIELIKIT